MRLAEFDVAKPTRGEPSQKTNGRYAREQVKDAELVGDLVIKCLEQGTLFVSIYVKGNTYEENDRDTGAECRPVDSALLHVSPLILVLAGGQDNVLGFAAKLALVLCLVNPGPLTDAVAVNPRRR